MHSRSVTWLLLPLLVLFAAGCDEDPTGSAPTPPDNSPKVLGLVEVIFTADAEGNFTASARPVVVSDIGAGGPRTALNPLPTGSGGGLQLEFYSAGAFTEGPRGSGGQRYLLTTLRARNAASNGTAYGVARSNVTLIAVGTSGTAAGTPVSVLRRFDNTDITGADRDRIAQSIVPTAAVRLGDSLQMEPSFVDVLQAFDESEVAAITPPAGITNIFPYGFVVRNPRDPNSRTLPANPATDQWDGLVSFGLRVPLEPNDPGTSNGPSKDPFTIGVVFLIVEDTETRVTEAIEEQTPAGRAAVAARAAALGATTYTVLAGSPTTGQPGQRQLCSVRTAGTAGSVLQTITRAGAYTHLRIFREGETVDPCAANFIGGTTGRPGVGLTFNLTVRAMDRYGNVITTALDSVRLTSTDGTAVLPSRTALSSGQAVLPVVFNSYGFPVVTAIGRRQQAARSINVNGISRTWTGAVSTDWSNGGNWNVGVAPASLDTAIVPTGVPNFPSLTSNTSIGGVDVADGATLNLGSFNLTASSSVFAGATTGGITNSTGTLFLSGVASQVRGILPRVRVNGTYSLTGNVTSRAPIQVDGGRLTNASYRVQVSSY